jgi:hypothetical protein
VTLITLGEIETVIITVNRTASATTTATVEADTGTRIGILMGVTTATGANDAARLLREVVGIRLNIDVAGATLGVLPELAAPLESPPGIMMQQGRAHRLRLLPGRQTAPVSLRVGEEWVAIPARYKDVWVSKHKFAEEETLAGSLVVSQSTSLVLTVPFLYQTMKASRSAVLSQIDSRNFQVVKLFKLFKFLSLEMVFACKTGVLVVRNSYSMCRSSASRTQKESDKASASDKVSTTDWPTILQGMVDWSTRLLASAEFWFVVERDFAHVACA